MSASTKVEESVSTHPSSTYMQMSTREPSLYTL
jgi:hypothetical protein